MTKMKASGSNCQCYYVIKSQNEDHQHRIQIIRQGNQNYRIANQNNYNQNDANLSGRSQSLGHKVTTACQLAYTVHNH